MLKKLTSPRLNLLILAVSLLITTTILGLSAYLTGSENYGQAFTIVADSDIELEISGIEYTGDPIARGQVLELGHAVKNKSSVEANLFAEITSMDTDVFAIDGGTDLGGNWSDLYIDGRKVYYLGSGDVLGKLGPNGSAELFNTLSIAEDAPLGLSSLAITVYAIQTLGLESKTPIQVWGNL